MIRTQNSRITGKRKKLSSNEINKILFLNRSTKKTIVYSSYYFFRMFICSRCMSVRVFVAAVVFLFLRLALYFSSLPALFSYLHTGYLFGLAQTYVYFNLVCFLIISTFRTDPINIHRFDCKFKVKKI